VRESQGFSREFLEELWEVARKKLPGWVYASLRAEARSRAGGRARHRQDEPSTVEKLALVDIRPEMLARATDEEVLDTWYRLNQWFASAKQHKKPVEDYVNAAIWVLAEFDKRGFEATDTDLKAEADKLASVRKSMDVGEKLGELPTDILMVKDFISLVGSMAKRCSNPKDIDILVRAARDGGSALVDVQNVWLPLRNVLDPEKKDLLSFVWNAQGPHDTCYPLYDLILRRRDKIQSQVVKEDMPQNSLGLTFWKALEVKDKQKRPFFKTEAQYYSGNHLQENPCVTCVAYLPGTIGSPASRCQLVEGVVEKFGSCALYINALEQARFDEGVISLLKALEPLKGFKPPKPTTVVTTQVYEIDEIWPWAETRLPVAVEPKLNGYRGIISKKGDRVSIWFERAIGKDLSKRFPTIIEAMRGFDRDVILDVDFGIERDGERLPRIDLGVLDADEPELSDDDRVVISAFDVPYLVEDITQEPFKRRRETLEQIIGQIESEDIRITPLEWVENIDQLREASHWAFDQPRSEGLMAKSSAGNYSTDGGTKEWAELKRVAELKVIALKRNETASGSYTYECGLAAGASDWRNVVEYNGKPYIVLGKTYSTTLKAKPGDVLTVEVQELVPDKENGMLIWLGPKVVDIDSSQELPFSAEQAIDITTRSQVLQKKLELPLVGPKFAPIAFIGGQPGRLEFARKEHLAGMGGDVFNRLYLEPLGLTRQEIIMADIVPKLLLDNAGNLREPTDTEVANGIKEVIAKLDELQPAVVVSLGRLAQKALGSRVNYCLPHPMAVLRYGDSGEIGRKLRRLKQEVEIAKQKPHNLEEGGEDTRGSEAMDAWFENWQDYLPKSGRGKFVYQHHWRGVTEDELNKTDAELINSDHSLHGDLRFTGDGGLWGWAVLIGSADENKKVGGDKLIALDSDSETKLRLAPKLQQPSAWLNIGVDKPYIAEPGGPGATSETYAKFFAMDHGTYQIGVAKRSAIEVFLDGKHLKGRYLLQLAEFEEGGTKRRVWLIDKPEEQTPIIERQKLDDEVKDLKQKGQKYLVWGGPNTQPKLIDIQAYGSDKSVDVPIVKVDSEKRIVYGVVLDPYGEHGPAEDAHNDWMPPGEIEKTAHRFLQGDMTVGLQHDKKANARVVESWVEQYPTREDYLAAMQLKPHKVWARPFGTDKVHSGSWCLGVELGPDEWAAFKSGEINAFSPGGLGIRTPIDRSAMPRVTYVELVPRQSER